MARTDIVQSFPSGPLATNAYVLTCTDTNYCAIIDPGIESASVIIPYIEEHALIPQMILLTHSHWDHIADVHLLKDRYKIPTYIHPEDVPNLEKPGIDGLPLFVPIHPNTPDHLLEDQDKVTIGSLSLQVIHTPGHSPGGVSFYLEKQEILFSGDTLFKGSIGNLSLPTANAEKMWSSLSKLSKLPPKTKVYPGHGDSTVIEKEAWLPDARQIFGG